MVYRYNYLDKVLIFSRKWYGKIMMVGPDFEKGTFETRQFK